MAKHKVGDVVLLKCAINKVDELDQEYPYCGDIVGWFSDKSVLCVIAQAEPQPLKVGDFVTGQNGGGTCQVLQFTDNDRASVLFGSGSVGSFAVEILRRTDKPADWPF